ncbi:uncharacterized protein [Nicotiana tomentosiformis]|uniref:uncharacterized protein n=1 Tax=Nicotiana tomentosiformis TaxID=4098 RepID=UPI00388C91C5
MEVFEKIPNFRAWVYKLLIVAHMEKRSGKYLSHRFGFLIRGISPASISSTRPSVTLAQESISSSSSKRKIDGARGSDGEEDIEKGSLERRSRARRRVVSNDENNPSHKPQPSSIPFSLTDEPEFPLASFPISVLVNPREPLPEVTSDATPVATSTSSAIPVATTPHVEFETSSSKKPMKKVVEVTEGGNLLRKSGQADVWLKPLLGLAEKSKLESNSSLTLMNDIVHSSLKINLIGTELVKRIVHVDQQVIDYRTEVDNWKGQFEGLQLEKEVLAEEKNALEQQMKMIAAKLAIEKASSSQVGKDKDILDSSFAEQLSKATEEIRSLKELLNQKEVYGGKLVQTLTQTKEDLCVSTDKIQFLERSLAPLKTAYDASQTLVEANKESFDLSAKIPKAKEAIEKTQQRQSFSSLEVEDLEGNGLVPGEADVKDSSSQINPSSPVDDVPVDDVPLDTS